MATLLGNVGSGNDLDKQNVLVLGNVSKVIQ